MKKLSDGTVATKGLVVVCINGSSGGCKAGEVTHILKTTAHNGVELELDVVIAKDNKVGASNIYWYESVYDLRKATPEEEQKYLGK